MPALAAIFRPSRSRVLCHSPCCHETLVHPAESAALSGDFPGSDLAGGSAELFGGGALVHAQRARPYSGTAAAGAGPAGRALQQRPSFARRHHQHSPRHHCHPSLSLSGHPAVGRQLHGRPCPALEPETGNRPYACRPSGASLDRVHRRRELAGGLRACSSVGRP